MDVGKRHAHTHPLASIRVESMDRGFRGLRPVLLGLKRHDHGRVFRRASSLSLPPVPVRIFVGLAFCWRCCRLSAVGQIGNSIPHAPYICGDAGHYSAGYRDAERGLRQESRRGSARLKPLDRIPSVTTRCWARCCSTGLNAKAGRVRPGVPVDLAVPELVTAGAISAAAAAAGPRRRAAAALGTKLAVGHAWPVLETEQVFIGELDPRRHAAGRCRSHASVADQRGGNHSHVGLGDSPARSCWSAGQHDPIEGIVDRVVQGDLSPPNHWWSA